MDLESRPVSPRETNDLSCLSCRASFGAPVGRWCSFRELRGDELLSKLLELPELRAAHSGNLGAPGRA